ncbi:MULTISPECIES: ACT domain-containing protein [unclassified Enterococcus]|uniref:ACT domain-containing protein n=1 Tax=unclassified Enterococcus TaxID=2608891 RepID=UPI001552B06E|nr:ACT domain-containing protein [Enterococcus sp. MMGLQ5-2]MBS7583764.1 ACT domain-containing protein [Enterococcus sp. MMGLQ5-1]NPD11625.1 ACT domain-containing protein [Enterococcus sp. MMGLQ5-1]NPD36586.1 ACT domain-containing protein [Enterococcus sp. MMGLQ5-2]
MKAIVTVIGKDKVGIIAGVSAKLAELEINIIDVTQTILNDYFTMMMMVEAKEGISVKEASVALKELGEKLGVSIHIQNEEIFNAMHKL